ncbi:MAG: hypothetical protein F4139_12870 [Gemmatimonadetes bacterium]|nr:hypothetical protein [Gemmatimonadota bacterium]MYH53813.1 hypothetical protein [Gemmatimonadota bacterium]MYK65838.1 hypothetical protein [Gemmatimonadota bacterium]
MNGNELRNPTRGPPRRGPRTGVVSVGALTFLAIPAACSGPDAPSTTDAEADAAGAEVRDGDLPVAPAGARLYPDVAVVADAAWHDGVWFVLDGRADQVHRIGPDGAWLGSFADRGEGPGELRGNARPIVVPGDTVVVLDDWGLHLYGLDGTPLADRRVLDDQCGVPAVVDMAPGSPGLLFVARCYERYGVETRWRVVLNDHTGTARTLVTDTADVTEVRFDRGFARIAAHPRGFVFGHTGEDCLGLFDFEGGLLDRICHEWMDRVPVPKAFADEYMESSNRNVGIRVHRPEHFPPILAFRAAGDEELVYLSPVDPEGWAGVLLLARSRDGGQLVLPIPRAAAIFVSGTTALAAWYELEGTRIQLYDLDFQALAAQPVFPIAGRDRRDP